MRLKTNFKRIVVTVLSATMLLGTAIEADASTVYRDDWYLSIITPTTGTTTDTVRVLYNQKKSYTGVCSRSTSSYDSVAMGGTTTTTITSSVSVFRQAGDVQTITANVSGTDSNREAKFKMTLTCNNGQVVNEGYVYWIKP